MTRDDYLKQQPAEDFNSVYAKLKRAQLHIMSLKKENEQLRAYNTDLERKYCRALKKVGVYRKWLDEAGCLEMMKDETLPTSGESS